VNSQTHEHPEAPANYPIYFERVFRNLRLPVWVAGPALAGIMGISFAVTDMVAGLSTLQRFTVVAALLISIDLAPILMVWIRNKSVVAYLDLLPVVDPHEHEKLMEFLSKTFDQRRSLEFALIVATGGVIHHVALSYFEWGRIWWYTIVDTVLVGFVWWFVVAAFLWMCVSVAAYSFLASKRLRFTLTIVSHTRMCGLESFGTLSGIPAVAWGTVATFGTLSTFDPFVLKQFPHLIVTYLSLDFLIAASSMTAIFTLPVLGYRAIVLPLKHSLSRQLDQLISRMGKERILQALASTIS